jgi:hypothetical protein
MNRRAREGDLIDSRRDTIMAIDNAKQLQLLNG